MTSLTQSDVRFLSSRRTECLAVGALMLVALVLRVIYVFGMQDNPAHHEPVMDSAYHVEWARAFANGEAYHSGPFLRAPLYIWFLGSVMKVFGTDDLLAPRLLQAVFGAATTGLIYLVGKRVFDRRVGFAASCMGAVYWVLIYFDGELLIPTLVVPLNMLALWLTLGLGRESKARDAVATGLLWGVSAIARPNVLLFMLFLAMWLLWMQRRAWRRGLGQVGLVAVGCLVPILPITAHNYFVGNDLVLISSQAGANFWIGNNPDSDGTTAIVPGTRAGWWQGNQDVVALAETAEGRKLKPSEVSQHYFRRAWEFIVREPSRATALFLHKLRLFWLDWELSNNHQVRFFAHRFSWAARVPLGFSVLASFGVLGLLLSVRSARHFPLWGFVVVYMLSVVGFFVCARYRVPVLPVLMVFAAHAAVWLWTQARERRFLRAALCLAAVAAGAVYSKTLPPYIRTNDSSGFMQLGEAEARRGNLGQAVDYLREAVAIDEQNVFARVALAQMYHGLGRTSEAVPHLHAALRLRPMDLDAVVLLLRCLLAEQNLTDAEIVAKQAESLFPDHAVVSFLFAEVRRLQGQPEQAIRLYERCLRQNRLLFDASYALGLVQRSQGRLAQSASALERAIELVDGATGPADDLVFEVLIEVLLEVGDRTKACSYARRFAARKPGHPRARELMSLACRG